MNKMKNKFSMIEVRDFWNSVAERYDSSNKKFAYTHAQRFSEAMKYIRLKPASRLLNIWSRTGGAIPHLRENFKGIEILNLELSDKLIEIGKSKFPNEIFIQGSLHQFPFADNVFDCILSLETLEHVPDPFLFLKETNRILKSRSILLLSLPPYIVEYTSILSNLLKIGHGEGPHRFLSSKIVKQLIENAGFKLLFHKGTVFIPLNFEFLIWINGWLERHLQNTPLMELGIRQFYICQKKL